MFVVPCLVLLFHIFIVALSGKKLLVRASYTPHQRALIGEVTMEFVDKLPEV